MTNSTNEKTAPEGATSETANELGNGSTPTGYLAYRPDDTRTTYGTWGGDDLPMKDHITLIVPFKTAQRMYADGPQLIGLSQACADAQSAEVRKQREEQAAKEREEKLQRLRREIEETTYADELDALEGRLAAIYARVETEAQARLSEEGN